MATPEQLPPKTFGCTTISKKQLEVLNVVARGNPDGSYLSVEEIIERLSYKPATDAGKFIVRYMVAQGRLEKVKITPEGKVRPRVFYRLTKAGDFQINSPLAPLEDLLN